MNTELMVDGGVICGEFYRPDPVADKEAIDRAKEWRQRTAEILGRTMGGEIVELFKDNFIYLGMALANMGQDNRYLLQCLLNDYLEGKVLQILESKTSI